MTPETSLSKRELLLLTSLFLFESAIAVFLIALHLKGERSFQGFLPSRPGLVFLCAVVVFVMSGADLVHRYLVDKRSPTGRFHLVVMMNVVSVLVIVITGEIVVRTGSRSHMDGEVFGNVVLKPRSWDKARSRLLPKYVTSNHSRYLDYDDGMGWTVVPNQCSSDGLYCSSVEGARAPQKGVVFPKIQGKNEIALVGDSFTFGNEVSYEETWGHRLEQMLGDEFRVVNFGVGGYGLGQALVRYEQDVRERRPTVSILSFVTPDLRRTMIVYPPIARPHWNIPFSKPRFILQAGDLMNVNVTPPSTEEIFSAETISDLPLLEYEGGYQSRDWEQRWYHVSYLVRLLTSLFPSWEGAGPTLSDDALVSINASILNAFVRSAQEADSIPLVVFLPVRAELGQAASTVPLGKRVLKQAGIRYVDTTSCLSEVKPSERFMAGGHYSPQGNEAVAHCVHRAMKETLSLPVLG
ncbi:MAG: hypothetical protein IPM58_14340 [Nitrospira sp.]|nr:hypothetical protein [Nitrospira sp.]